MPQAFAFYLAKREEDGVVAAGTEVVFQMEATHMDQAIPEARAVVDSQDAWSGLNAGWLVSASGRVVWLWTPEVTRGA